MSDWRGTARVYLHPAPKSGPHPGYRGFIIADAVGVHLPPDAEYRGNDEEGWEIAGIRQTIPWPRVSTIEWVDE